MLTAGERIPRSRRVREHMLNYQDRKGPGSTTEGALRELMAAASELTVLVRLETGGGTDAVEEVPCVRGAERPGEPGVQGV